ncbi:putative nucleic acid-binding Zn-ribbon protein [Ancylobacter sp. 3268]|uniref:hypothetical protein n=1 Tax=Ancylobacter sp. 3268 TaxID=2817752 RepID=UPI002862C961|nr:hypothetical protein [Ancylobacter sp. 3268]MDR6954890.1 putative nucleic acid-binding Zn-ribbon protein [Ancylobacter sp. 3268]
MMPVVPMDDDAGPLGFRAPTGTGPEPVRPAPSVGDTFAAAFRLDNDVVNVARWLQERDAYAPDPSYDLRADIEGTKYGRDYRSDFLGSRSKAESDAIRARIDERERDLGTMAASGWMGTLAGISAGILSPTTLIPGAQIVKGVRIGSTIARSALMASAAGAAATAVQEGLLQAVQPGRGWEESAANIAGTAVLGGILGGAVGAYVHRADFERFGRDIETGELSTRTVDRAAGDDAFVAERDSSIGAAQAQTGDNALKGALGAAEALRFQDPMLRLQTSNFVESRRAIEMLAETPLTLEKNAAGIATAPGGSVETRVKMSYGNLARGLQDVDDLYSQYRFGRPRQTFDIARAELARLTGRSEGELTYSEFKAEIAKAMRRGDRHEIPQVAAAAQAMRAKVFDPGRLAAVEVGALDPDVGIETAESYLHRLPDREKVRAERPAVQQVITDYLRADQSAKAATQERLGGLLTERRGLDDSARKLQAQLERLEVSGGKLSARLDERAMEVRRATSRSDVLADRQELISEAIADDETFIREMRDIAADPTTREMIDRMEAELVDLRRADRPPTEAQLRQAEADEIKGILSGDNRAAAEIVVGRRKPYKAPSFLSWIVRGGGIEDGGGDVLAALGGDVRTRPGLVSGNGADADTWAERIMEASGGRLTERPEPNDVLNWIADATRGKDPDWWVDTRVDVQKQQVTALADAWSEVFGRAGIQPKTVADVGKVLRDERIESGADLVTLDDLDRIAAELEAAGEGVPVQARREQVEGDLFVQKDALAQVRQQIADARAARDQKQRRLGTASARGAEADVAARANVGRLGLLEQRLGRMEERRALIEELLANVDRRQAELRGKIESEAAGWKGDSTREFRTELRAREKAARAVSADAPLEKGSDDVLEGAIRAMTAARKDMSDDELLAQASQIVDHWISTPAGRLPYEIGGGRSGPAKPEDVRGPLARRSFAIPDALLEPWLENDIEVLARAYTRTLAPDVAIIRNFGDLDLTEAKRKIVDERDRRLAEAVTPKDRLAIQKGADRDLKTLDAVRDRIRGVYALPSNPDGLLVRAGRIARSLNYLRLMGGVTISSIPDLGRPVMEYGLARTFRDGWIPFIAGFKDVRPIARREAQLAGTAIDMALDSRALAIADLMDDYGRTSKFERAIHGMSSNFGMVSLMAPWTDVMQQVTSLIAMNGMLRAAEAASLGKATAREIEKLAASGIDQPMAKRIWSEFAREGGGDTVRELRLPNTEAWADRGAIDAFRGALVREVDRVIIKPGQDKPLWMSTELGKLVGQFKGFAVASTQRILLAGLQQRDAHALSGLLMMVGLGAASYGIRSAMYGRDVSDDPVTWAIEGIDRSGALGWLMEANNISERLSRGHVGLSALTGEYASRYQSRNIYGVLGGPTADLAGDVAQISGAIAAGDMRATDLRLARRMAPYNNVFWLSTALDRAEHGLADAFSLPGRR